MPARMVTFDDGSSITWKDRETLLYEEPGYTLRLWVDYEPGLFSKGRILRKDSLRHWQVFPQGAEELISPEKRDQIIARVRQYFGNTPVRIGGQ